MKKAISILLSFAIIFAVTGCSNGSVPSSGDNPAAEGVTGGAETGQQEPATGEPIVWKFVSAFNRDAAEHEGFWLFYDRVNEELGDRLRIDYLGGTEIVAYFDQFEQLGKGTFEVGHLPVNMAENLLPCTDALYLTELTPMEMRENGTYDFMREKYADAMNLHFLGVSGGEDYAYTFYTNFEVNGLEDFKGKTIRTAPVFVPMLDALGAGSVSIGGGEVYTALERGVVDGFGWSTLGAVDYAWYEVVKYRIAPAFYPCNVGLYINKDAFDALPDDLKEAVEQIAAEVEIETYNKVGDMVRQEFATLEANGVETITLTGDLEAEWLAMARTAGWENLEKLDPENAAILRPMVTK